jgi:hypothetical protein
MPVIIITIFAIAVAAFIGWVMNIIDLLTNSYTFIQTIIRIIGIFVAPIGAIAGYF